MAVFVDFDGTVTDLDTFDALVRASSGDDVWNAIDAELHGGRITLREALLRQAALVRMSRSEALAFLEKRATVDPAFPAFVAAARSHGALIRIVSSGLRSVIEHALARYGVDIEVLANDVDFDEAGWRMSFLDESDNGHDKAAHVIAARASGFRTAFVGDGISDYDAALAADVRFAKAGRRLERYCRERGVPFVAFTSFSEVERALFG